METSHLNLLATERMSLHRCHGRRTSLPEGAEQVENDFCRKEYCGPCPRSGMRRYAFALFALNAARLKGVDKDGFFDEAERHVVDYAVLIGLYGH